MNTTATLIRPGLLVSLKTSVRGGVTYQQRMLDPDHLEGAARVAKWETTREIADAEEHEKAVIARGRCRTVISRVCCPSTFGLLCPQSNEDKLFDAVDEAQEIARTYNRSARFTRLEVFVITGRIADSDEQAAKAIGSEVRDLIAAMEEGVRKASPEVIREAANKARALAGMLSSDAQTKVTAAIAEVRAIASDIVRRVEKAGEVAADVVRDVKLEKLQNARFAVLDLTEIDTGDDQPAPIAGRSIDLDPDDEASVPPQVAAPAIELEAAGA
jgi:hypothetical protein